MFPVTQEALGIRTVLTPLPLPRENFSLCLRLDNRSGGPSIVKEEDKRFKIRTDAKKEDNKAQKQEFSFLVYETKNRFIKVPMCR